MYESKYPEDKSEKADGKLFTVMKTNEKEGIRLALVADKSKLFNPEVKDLFAEIFAENMTLGVSEFAEKHGHLPAGQDEIAEAIGGAKMKSKMEAGDFVVQAFVLLIEKCYADDAFIHKCIDRAAEIAAMTKKES